MSESDRLGDRGTLFCRACDSRDLVTVLDLGSQPLANRLLSDEDSPDPAFPLHLRSCRSCGLGQLGEFVLPESIFSDYPYLSSVSTSWVEHARDYATRLTAELGLGAEHLVVEVASNDGYLLSEFRALAVPVLGVEPAANVAAIAQAAGVETVVAFFGRGAARDLVARSGHPRLVVANNVLAHVPDLHDFVGGLSELCDAGTVITVENPTYLNLLQGSQFDTIYHEHYSYLSAHAVQRLAARHGLELFRVEALPTHGGSYRYWLALTGSQAVDGSVAAAVADELSRGLLTAALWESFATSSREAIAGLSTWLRERSTAGDRVVGYGAAAKGNTLMNAAGVGPSDLLAVVDGSTEKQGKLLPGSRVPVLPPAVLGELAPTHILVLPWNLVAEIDALASDLVPSAQTWTAIPRMSPYA